MATKKKPVSLPTKTVSLPSQSATKIPEKVKATLTDRQKFHTFFREVYLKEPADMEAPHHPDKHGILGYETNVVKMEIMTSDGIWAEQEVNGLCEYCSVSQESAKEAYGKS